MNEKPKDRIGKRKPIILIVDDVPKNVQILGTLLKKIECDLAVALNGEQALNIVARVIPDLILLDIMMPGMDGHEVCRRLKMQEETKNIPIIFLSAKAEAEDIMAGYELGAVDYLTKPFIASELLSRVRTHLALKKVKENLEEEIGSKNKFFSIISHDLKGSLGIILSFVQLLQNNRETLSVGETNELLGDIESTSRNTLDLLENLLEWAKSQTGRINFNPVQLDLAAMVDEALNGSRDVAKSKHIELSTAFSTQNVFADRNMLLLIIRNLVSNAIKFTHGGGKVSVGTARLNGSVRIFVSDNGVGMDTAKTGQLFKIDNKVSTPGTENEQGNGLGLILCKEFVQHHGGEIGIESVPGEGTTVWFTLPLKGNGRMN